MVKISDQFIYEKIEEALEDAVRYGIRRAYKHSNAAPPTEAQIDTITNEVWNAVREIFVLGNSPPDPPEAA